MQDQKHYRQSRLRVLRALGKMRQGTHNILGDAGFSRNDFLVPFNRREVGLLSEQQKVWYKDLEFALAQSRTVVEQVFAHLKNAWGVFKKPLDANSDHFAHGRHFQACCHLHNYRCHNRRTWVRGVQWRAGPPRNDWEEMVLTVSLRTQDLVSPQIDVHDTLGWNADDGSGR